MIHWVGLLIVRDHKVLLTKEFGKDYYAFPGGGQESDETDMQTLTRELQEEICSQFSCPYQLFDEVELVGKTEGQVIHFRLYQADLSAADFAAIHPGPDIEDLQWVNYAVIQQQQLQVSHLVDHIFPLLRLQHRID